MCSIQRAVGFRDTEQTRAKRANPGLLRQHLIAVDAVEAVGCAGVAEAEVNSPTRGQKDGPVDAPCSTCDS